MGRNPLTLLLGGVSQFVSGGSMVRYFLGHLIIVLLLGVPFSSSFADAPDSKVRCEEQGGSWGQLGLFQEEVCNLPTSDAGQPCKTHSECEGSCITEDSVKAGTSVTGRCYKRSIARGVCLNFVKDGIAGGHLCVD